MERDKPRGIIKSTPLDFRVDEIPAYEPSGEGSHVFVHFRKTNLTTDEAVRAIARALDVDRRDIGVAGLKDKVGVTTQWISVPAKDASIDARIGTLAIEGIEILAHRRHGNKLRTGHLRGNRFAIVVRGIDPSRLDEIRAAFERIAREGVPNAFGAQRFGRDKNNVERARAWLTGRERAPGDHQLRRLHFSAVQAAAFNAVLQHRVREGIWNVPIPGDLLKKEDTGGLFVCTDVQMDRERAAAAELCPTGPIVGDRMRQPEGEARELEQRIVGPFIEGIDLRRARSLGEGTRRALVLRVAELSHSPIDSSLDEPSSSDNAVNGTKGGAIEVRFVLPKGAYATTVLENVFSVVDAARMEATGEARGATEPDHRQELETEEE